MEVMAGAAGAVVAGLFFLLRGLSVIARKPRLGSLGSVFGAGLGGAGAVAGLAAFNMQTYQRLTFERPVANIALVEKADGVFEAVVTETGEPPVTYELKGDQWRLEAEVVKFKPWATLAGRDSLYRLDRLSGRFDDPALARTNLPTIHGFQDSTGLIADASDRVSNWFTQVDARYGSGVFLPMADGALFEVSMSQTGLIARPLNEEARAVAPAN